ncbi:MAG: hypothetical protein K1X94_19760 [Sandaracinaceae bacterium]|nr:hypothetical protein [Sandaracinaceae bacterium]
MLRVLLSVVLGGVLTATSEARAQAPEDAAPETLVLVGVIASDAPSGLADAITDALATVAIERGYRIVPRGPGAPAPDLSSASDLAVIASTSSAARTLHVQVSGVVGARTLHVGVAGALDVGAAAVARTVSSDQEITAALGEMARQILPSPIEPLTGAWVPPLRVEARRTVTEAPLRRVRVRVPVRPQTTAARAHVPVALIAGAAVLGGGWILDIVTGALGGYHDRTCVDLGALGGCSGPGGPAFDPAWSDFRAFSLVPIAGPWVQLALLPDTNNLWPFWLVLDGLVQAGGLVALLAGAIDEATRGGGPPTRQLRVAAWMSREQVSLAVHGAW